MAGDEETAQEPLGERILDGVGEGAGMLSSVLSSPVINFAAGWFPGGAPALTIVAGALKAIALVPTVYRDVETQGPTITKLANIAFDALGMFGRSSPPDPMELADHRDYVNAAQDALLAGLPLESDAAKTAFPGLNKTRPIFGN